MTSLAELAVGFDAVEQALEASGGELTDELAAELECLSLAEREKVDRVVFFVRGLEGQAEALKRLEEEIAAKRKAKQRARESLLAYVHRYMDTRFVTRLQGEVFRFQLVRNGGQPLLEVLVPVEDLPPSFVKTAVFPDREVIREAVLQGNVSPQIARFGPIGTSVRIY